MSDIQPVMTQQAKATGAAAQNGVTAKGAGFFSLGGGLAFWDMLAPKAGAQANMIAPLKTAEVITAPQTIETELSGDDQLELAAAIDAALLELLGEKDGEEEGAVRPLSLLDILNAVNGDAGAGADEKTLFAQVVERLVAGLPLESRKEQDLDALIDRLKKQSEFLKTGKINDEEVPITLLIALGVSPAELTQITEKIARLEDKLGRKITVEDIIAGVGGLGDSHKDDGADEVLFAIGGVPAKIAGAGQATGGQDNAGAAQQGADSITAPMSGSLGDERGRYGDAAHGTANDAAAHNVNAVAGVKGGAAIPAGMTNTAAQAAAGTAGQTGAAQANSGAILFDAAMIVGADGTLTLDGMEIQTGIPLTQATLAAHATTAATQAGQAHPATQMVASALQKMARAGGPSELTIHMDPPELGRVIAKMQFGKDKTVKAILMVEKPETYHMLIRDAASLERALQNAGLTADSASLSFELAQDGSAFNSNNNGQGGGEPHGGQTGTELANGNGQEEIAATMTWRVDSETGHVSYNLLA